MSAQIPPVAPRIAHTEIRHGAEVHDDYYWLREKHNPKVVEYLQAENAYTAAMTKDLEPFSEALYTETLGRIKQTDLSVPAPRGGYLYYSRTEEGKQYPIQCRRKGSMEAPEEVLLDPNELAKEHKFVGIGAFRVSDDQNLLAFTVDYTGFRQYSLEVKDLRTGKLLGDTIERVTSVEWAADNRHLFVTTEDALTKRSDKLLHHLLESADFKTIYTEKDELFDIELHKSHDKSYILLDIESKDTSEVRYLKSSRAQDPAFAILLPREKKHRYYVEHRLGQFYIRTNKYGKNFAVVTAPDSNPAVKNWKMFLPHRDDVRLEHIDPFKDFVVSVEKTQALERLRVYNFETEKWTAIEMPEPVYAVSPAGTADFDSTVYRYNYQSFVTPPSVFDYDTGTGTSTLLKQQEVLGGYDPKQYTTERLWATARDGTKVPISIVYKKGLKRDGTAPLFLYGYGSYGIGISPGFNSSRFSLVDRGMSYAIAHIRGGDEMGEQWREDGMLMKKKNTFYDFIDCAEYLIKEKWTSSDRLVIEGASAGGMLMGAVVNLRPDLFRAVHAGVPFVDVMNTMLDASLPLTVGEYLEWGNPSEKEAYDYVRSYSPYDNLEKHKYPAILVTTSFNDSQVMYWEPAKYVAKMRTVKEDGNPLLLKVKMDPAGHGGASGRYDRLRDQAFEFAWMLSEVGITR